MQFYVFKNFLFFIIVFSLFVTATFLPNPAHGQSDTRNDAQQKSDLSLLIKRAEQDQYNVMRVEFIGNTNISGRVLFRKIRKHLNEGDIFTRQNLYQSLTKLSKIKAIYAVRLEDVEVKLDEERKIIDLTIKIREKKRLQ